MSVFKMLICKIVVFKKGISKMILKEKDQSVVSVLWQCNFGPKATENEENKKEKKKNATKYFGCKIKRNQRPVHDSCKFLMYFWM